MIFKKENEMCNVKLNFEIMSGEEFNIFRKGLSPKLRRWLFWLDLKNKLIPFRLQRLYDRVKHAIFDTLNPRQKWLTKHISNSWMDKDHIIEVLLPQILIHYVEKELKLDIYTDSFTTTSEDGGLSRFLEQLQGNYKIIKLIIPDLENQIQNIYLNMPEDRGLAGVEHQKIITIQTEIYSLHTEVFYWIIKNRGQLWS